MPNKRRECLRVYFEDGKLPTGDHFRDLIDSNLNMLDEGFSKSDEHGFEIKTPPNSKAFISLFSDEGADQSDWRLAHEGNGEQLLFQTPRRNGHEGHFGTLLRVDRRGFLDVLGQNVGKHETRGGVIRSGGRQGWKPNESTDQNICTDGRWHDITGSLQGCQAFEVMAGVSDRTKNRFSLMHAVAVSTFNRRNPWWRWLLRLPMGIRYTQAYLGTRCDKLELRWHGNSGAEEGAGYSLQIRSKCDWGTGGGEAVPIKCYLTRLWFDEVDQNNGQHLVAGVSNREQNGTGRTRPS